MSDQDERGQGTRAEVEAQRRRRRGSETLAADARLPIPPDVKAELDRKGLVPRWANDEGNRMHRLTVQDDYEKVEGVEPVPVAVDKTGKPILAHLLAKRRDFIEEDRGETDRKRKVTEEALFRKPDAVDAAGVGANPDQPASERYVTRNSSISRGGNEII